MLIESLASDNSNLVPNLAALIRDQNKPTWQKTKRGRFGIVEEQNDVIFGGF